MDPYEMHLQTLVHLMRTRWPTTRIVLAPSAQGSPSLFDPLPPMYDEPHPWASPQEGGDDPADDDREKPAELD